MTSTNIATLPVRARKTPAAPRAVTRTQSRALKRRLRRQAFAALAIGGVATVLTALSLAHLATGIHIVTGAEGWEAWAFAVGIDVAMISAELAMLFAATPSVRKQIAVYGMPFVRGTLGSSAALNAFAFYSGSCGTSIALKAAAISFGVAIPLLIYALIRMGACLYMGGDR